MGCRLSRTFLYYVNGLIKELVYILGCLCRDFVIWHIHLLCHFPGLLARYFPVEIDLIAEQNTCRIDWSIILEDLRPCADIFERLAVRNIKNKDSAASVLQIARNEWAIALLPGCVPKLESVGGLAVQHVLGELVNSYSGLGLTIWCT